MRMAHIPYGYRIEDGHAVADAEKARKLNAFIEAYLGGLSFKEARRAAGVELSEACLRVYMRNGTFTGTEYYPPIVPEGMWERVTEEMARRTHPGFSILPDALPVHTKFQTAKPKGPLHGSAAEVAAEVYNLITPAEYGRTFMNTAEQAMIRAWVGI